jgi:hypothetical protein
MWLRMLRLMFGLIPWLHSSCPVPKTRKVSRCPPQPQMVPSRTRVWYVFHLQFTGGCWRFLFFHGYRRQWVFVNHPFLSWELVLVPFIFPFFLVAVEFSMPRILLPLFLRWSNHVKGLSNPSDWCFFVFFVNWLSTMQQTSFCQVQDDWKPDVMVFVNSAREAPSLVDLVGHLFHPAQCSWEHIHNRI